MKPAPRSGQVSSKSQETERAKATFHQVAAECGFVVFDLQATQKTDPSAPRYVIARDDQAHPVAVWILGDTKAPKTDDAGLTVHQRDRADYLEACGFRVEVWKPSQTMAMIQRLADA